MPIYINLIVIKKSETMYLKDYFLSNINNYPAQ